ncbi:MAG: His/Gly/Thr/Pro-type tRNA ligase C-terminal domain-containing protein [Candidatus Poseidoniaceae archaeon]|nr:His/Gly/Thr/Pro-type tRNA ligase C-terminal domain-containing protein [Candidatus Poseidoniaceae archaeon]
MPPAIAPWQVVVCPMIRKNSDVDTVAISHEVAETLRNAGLRVHVDDRDLHPGQKYYDWEIKGVPLRLDIGPRDVEQGTAFAAKRTGGKQPLPMDNIVQSVNEVLDEISEVLRGRSSEHMEHVIQPLPEFVENDGEWSMNGEVKEGHIYELPFDGTDAHAEVIERTTGLTFLGDSTDEYADERPCHMSGKPTKRRILLAKTY